jgi:PAT family beta-lactamase induction signal transducer AmpG
MATNLLFALLAILPADTLYLSVVIGADNLSGGLAGSAFIAYLSSLTNRAYTATQYALFSSLMLLPAKFVGGFSGDVVEAFGFVPFFIYTALLGIPAIILISYLIRHPITVPAEE